MIAKDVAAFRAQEQAAFDLWKANASAALLDYAKSNAVFTAEAAWHKVCAAVGQPSSLSIKGYLFRETLVKPGHLIDMGTERSGNKQAKGRKVTLWKSKLCADTHEMQTSAQALAAIKTQIHLRQITLMEGLNKAFSLGAQSFVG